LSHEEENRPFAVCLGFSCLAFTVVFVVLRLLSLSAMVFGVRRDH
jgi:hypothetical protein